MTNKYISWKISLISVSSVCRCTLVTEYVACVFKDTVDDFFLSGGGQIGPGVFENEPPLSQNSSTLNLGIKSRRERLYFVPPVQKNIVNRVLRWKKSKYKKWN